MPLVIFCIIVFAVVYIINDNAKKKHGFNGQVEQEFRKTNARFENLRFMYHYFEEGQGMQVAFSSAVKDTIDAGFDPCIPMKAYEDARNRPGKHSEEELFLLGNLDRYDSAAVTLKRKNYYDKYIKDNIAYGKELGLVIQNPYSDDRYSTYSNIPDSYVYDNFPKNKYEWELLVNQSICEMRSMKVGDRCTYNNSGTCEVVQVIFNYNKTKADYRLKSITNGNTFIVKGTDKGIYRL